MAKVREVLFDLMRELGMTKILEMSAPQRSLLLQNFPPDLVHPVAPGVHLGSHGRCVFAGHRQAGTRESSYGGGKW